MTTRFQINDNQERGLMLTICTADCGEMTEAPHGTFDQMKFAAHNLIDCRWRMISIKSLHVVKATLTAENLHWFSFVQCSSEYCPR